MPNMSRSRSHHIASANASPEEALLEAARIAARAAARAEFKLDPLFSPELSRLNSIFNSAIKRQGPLIERGISDTLENAGLTVLRNIVIPVTRGALALTESDDYSTLIGKQIDFNQNDIVGYADIDTAAIDEAIGWIGAFQTKRGGGQTETKKRRASEKEIRAINFTVASWGRQKGYRVDTGTAAVIDFYGQSGFSKDITINRDGLDEFFEIPIVASIDRMTAVMSEALNAELRVLLETIMRTVCDQVVEETVQNTAIKGAATPLRSRRRNLVESINRATKATAFHTPNNRH